MADQEILLAPHNTHNNQTTLNLMSCNLNKIIMLSIVYSLTSRTKIVHPYEDIRLHCNHIYYYRI